MLGFAACGVAATRRLGVRYKKLLIGLVVGTGLLTAAWAGLKSISVSYGYHVEAEFSELPSDDSALEAWLLAQPGVVRVIIARDKKAQLEVVEIIFIQVRDGWGRPPFPDLEAKCDGLGYRGRVGMFRDRPR